MRLASPSPRTPAGPRGSERVLDADGRVGVFLALVRGVGSGFGVCVRFCCVCVGGGRCAWLCRCPPNFVFYHRRLPAYFSHFSAFLCL